MRAIPRALLAAVLICACIAVVAAALFNGLQSSPNDSIPYVAPAAAARATLGQIIGNGYVSLRLNDVSDANSPKTSDLWINYSRYFALSNFPLAPPEGSTYLVANVTVINAQNVSEPFRFSDFRLVGSDGNTYYPNNAVCGDQGCSDSMIRNSTLLPAQHGDLYVLFSVPTSVSAAKIVYSSSDPTHGGQIAFEMDAMS
jgi:Domain of unknown function (DUF4352)